jgi:hypothetical protein
VLRDLQGRGEVKRGADGRLHLFVLGAQSEATLPGPAWLELQHQLPGEQLSLYLIGPDVPQKAHGTRQDVDGKTRIHRLRGRAHEVLPKLAVKPSLVTMFNPGIGYKGGATEEHWLPTLRLLLGLGDEMEAKGGGGVGCPLLLTCFDEEDQTRDLKLLDSLLAPVQPSGRVRWLIPPGPNALASLRKGVDYRHDMNHIIASNSTLFSLRIARPHL